MRYSAFISYNHKDRRWADWLLRALETYRIPDQLHGRNSPVGVLGPKLPPVYLDREEMVTASNLSETVQVALSQSATLIVICSPSAVQSRWVNEEIRSYRALGRAQHIHYLIVEGEPNASTKPGLDPALECFPAALFDNGPFDPVAADLRPNTDGKAAAKLRLIAGMLGVGFDKLRQREASRQQRRLMAIAGISATGFVVTSGLAVFALVQRGEAIEQREIAEQKTMTAERTVDFVKSMFIVSDPSEAKGETITAREILDRGAHQISNSLNNEPAVKAELATTLSEVYGGLGLFKRSDALIKEATQVAQRAKLPPGRQLAAQGEAQLRLGLFDDSIRSFGLALTAVRTKDSGQTYLIPRIYAGLSESYSLNERYDAAQSAAAQSLRLAKEIYGENDPAVARAYEVVGMNALNSGDLKGAPLLFQKAISIRQKAQGDLHPLVTENLNQLGDIAYLQKDAAKAESYYRQVLANDDIVFGEGHPQTASTLNNLGRVLLERRKYVDALGILNKAVTINLTQQEPTNFNLVFPFANRAMAQHRLGNLSAATADFRKGLTAARLHKHRNLAPILADLADTLCDQRKFAEAFRLLDEAMPIMKETYPDDPWRTAWVVHIRGKCLVANGQRASGARLIQSSAPALIERWPTGTHYGFLVKQNLAQVGGLKP